MLQEMQVGKRSKTQPRMNICENREGQNAWLYCLLLLFLIDWQTLPYRTSQCFSSEHSQHTNRYHGKIRCCIMTTTWSWEEWPNISLPFSQVWVRVRAPCPWMSHSLHSGFRCLDPHLLLQKAHGIRDQDYSPLGKGSARLFSDWDAEVETMGVETADWAPWEKPGCPSSFFFLLHPDYSLRGCQVRGLR